jgi:hypothetical protein
MWHGSNSELLLGLVLIRRKHRAQIQPIEKVNPFGERSDVRLVASSKPNPR